MTAARTRTGSASRARPAAAAAEPEVLDSVTPRTGAKRTLMSVIRDIPNYLKLLYGLMTDPQVAMLDKLLVAGAIAYIIMPIDIIPDFIPFIGQVDDVFFLVVSLQRLVDNAGRRVLMAHWMGDPEDVSDLRFAEILSAASFFLPKRVRRALVRMASRRT